MPKITKKDMSTERITITAKTTEKRKPTQFKWWTAKKENLAQELVATASFLKKSQNWRQRQAAIFARLYGNQNLFSYIGSNIAKMDQTLGLPMDRPTFNLISSITDTLVSRISQDKPSPVFLTDNSDYQQRTLAKKLNGFIQGEFYRTKAYDHGEYILRDGCVEGTGCLKIIRTPDNKVGLDRVLLTEILIDLNEAIYGDPRQLYHIKLVDRDVAKSMFPGFEAIIDKADKATPDNSGDSSSTVADMILLVEGWHLRSGEKAKDGRHTIACSAGVLLDDETWDKKNFPFAFLHYTKRLLGFWGQGVAERQIGTQTELNQILHTIARAIKLVGVPRVFMEQGAKVSKATNNNEIGVIITYKGTKPSYEVAPCNAQELYQERDRLIQYGYRSEGVSEMAAASQKPAGLDSGEAIRTYENITADRFSTLTRHYQQFFVDLTYLMMDEAIDIAKEDGKYATIYPNKNGVREIQLPKLDMQKDPFVIQCYTMSSLPKDPAGRQARIAEMIQSGMITIREGRRLMDFPDLQQMETLANAAEERIFQYLDDIIEDGKYTAPDPFMDIALGKQFLVQYYNLYIAAKLPEAKAQMLRNFWQQLLVLEAASQPKMPQPAPNTPQASPMPLPQSPLVPNAVPNAMAA